MKLDFLPGSALDDEVHRQYCLYCHAESVEWFVEGGSKRCRCSECGQVADRAIVLDPAISWWLGPDGEYWHHTAGIFVRDTRHRFLFFERTAFPFALTIPAGHVDRDEKPKEAAVRELREETGIVREELRLVTHIPIPGDQCRRGSDSHDWHVYLATVPEEIGVRITEQEGESPVWLTLNDARTRSLTFAVRHLIDNLADSLTAD
jgi:8-oxo-dGTP pyrophosphatase MutT (NUDIX family)